MVDKLYVHVSDIMDIGNDTMVGIFAAGWKGRSDPPVVDKQTIKKESMDDDA